MPEKSISEKSKKTATFNIDNNEWLTNLMSMLKKEKGKDKRGSMNIKVENNLCQT